jgi:hypothetical protein
MGVAICVALLLFIGMVMYAPSARSMVPRPLYGHAYYGDGTGEPATGAKVTAVNMDTSEVLKNRTTVGEEGYYSFDVGFPGPAWGDGTRVKVFVNGTDEYARWTGQATLTLESGQPTQRIPDIHLQPPPPGQPVVSGPTTAQENESVTFTAVATDPNGFEISYGWDWDDDGGVDEWTRLRPSGDPCSVAHSWGRGGSYRIRVVARNEHGVNSTWSSPHTITIGADTQPPNTYITDGPDGLIHEGTATFGWSGDDDVTPTSALQYTYMLEGHDAGWSTWTDATTVTYTDLSNGSYTFRVRARDAAHNVDDVPASRSFTVSRDYTAPAVTITQGPNGVIHKRGALFSWRGDDDVSPAGQLRYRYMLENHSGWSSWTGQTTAEYSSLSNGTYTFTVEATDTAGNTGSAARVFTVAATSNDTTPPSLTVTAPASGATVSGATLIEWQAADAGSAVTASVSYSHDNGTTWLSLAVNLTGESHTWDTGAVDNGPYQLRVMAADAAGNFNMSVVNVTVDNQQDDDTPAFGIAACLFAAIAALLIRKKNH